MTPGGSNSAIDYARLRPRVYDLKLLSVSYRRPSEVRRYIIFTKVPWWMIEHMGPLTWGGEKCWRLHLRSRAYDSISLFYIYYYEENGPH